MEFGSTAFWLALIEIIWINILLSGDNAVVIALAARSLPPQRQKQAIMIGSGAAIVMRIALTLVAAQLLALPWLKLIGAVLLLYIGVTLVLPEDEGEEGGGAESSAGMIAAVRTILIADLVMSLDNVIAVAAAAKGSTMLLVVGLAMSIPLVVFGSTLLLKVIERFPIIVWLGAALLGFIAGEIVVEDPVLKDSLAQQATAWGIDAHQMALICGALGAALVVAIGRALLKRRLASRGARAHAG